MSVNDIIGRQIDMVLLDQSKEFLRFMFDDGTSIVWSAVGDCCSHSWFESVEAFDFSGKVLRIDNPQIDEDESKRADDSDGELIRSYFMTVYSERGRLCLEMRNSSNGYYGGSIETGEGPMSQYGDPLTDARDLPASWKQVAP